MLTRGRPAILATSSLALVLLGAGCLRGADGASPTITGRPPPSSTTTAVPTTTSTSSTTTTTTAAPTTTTLAPTTAPPWVSRPAPTVPPTTVAPVVVAAAPETTAPPSTEPPAPPPTAAPSPAVVSVFAVGDSVMLGAADGLRSLPGVNVRVDAEVGRQFRAGIPLVRAAVADGANVVVIHLGTNGPFTDAQLEEMFAAASGAKVVIVTVQLPDEAYPHEAPTNAMLRDGAARHGAVVVDWNAASDADPSLLRPDGYHLDPSAVGAYTALVASAL